MLTKAPGLDVAVYHYPQIAVLDRRDWSSWLNAAGSLRVGRVG